MVKDAAERNEAAWREVLGTRDEVAKDRRMEVYKEERERLKGVFIRAKRKEGRKMNQDLDGNRKLFWKEVTKIKGGKVESCHRIEDGNGRG